MSDQTTNMIQQAEPDILLSDNESITEKNDGSDRDDTSSATSVSEQDDYDEEEEDDEPQVNLLLLDAIKSDLDSIHDAYKRENMTESEDVAAYRSYMRNAYNKLADTYETSEQKLFDPPSPSLHLVFLTPEENQECPCCNPIEDPWITFRDVTAVTFLRELGKYLYGNREMDGEDATFVKEEDVTRRLGCKMDLWLESVNYMHGDGSLLGSKLWISLQGSELEAKS